MIHLCYVSSAKYLMTQADLLEMLEQARRNNAERDISGMLLYKDLSFLQVLEGPVDAVHEIYGTICRDERHERITLLFDEPIEQRDFSTWAMGFENLDDRNLSDIDGYCDFMVNKGEARELFQDSSRARKLLLYFRAKS